MPTTLSSALFRGHGPLLQGVCRQFVHALQHGVQAVAARWRKLASQAELIEPVRQVDLRQFLTFEPVNSGQKDRQQATQ